MALKIESAEDLIAQHAPGHTKCGAPKSIEWAKGAITITCVCDFTLALGVDYLVAEALANLQNLDLKVPKESAVTKKKRRKRYHIVTR